MTITRHSQALARAGAHNHMRIPALNGTQSSRRHHSSHAPPRRRLLHSTASKDVAISITPAAATSTSAITITRSSSNDKTSQPDMSLAALPLSQVLRTYLIAGMSSSPVLLNASTKALRKMLDSNNPLIDLRNPVMRFILHQTFYQQFCAGENPEQIAKMCGQLRTQGYAGVILECALEVLQDVKSDEFEDVATWRRSMLDTIDVAAEGDFLGLKWSGMGPAAMRRMKDEEPPSKEMDEAMHTVCRAAATKNVALLPSAEETWNLAGYHKWSMDLQRAYNLGGKSVIFNTYQAYLKQHGNTLAQHLQQAKDEGFTLGVKIVRGAYLFSEKRNLIWPTIEGTHHAYDSTASALIHRKYNDMLKPAGNTESFPDINVVIASHNAATVEKTQAWRQQQAERGEEITPLVYAQLQGMADEVSCKLLAAAKANEGRENAIQEKVYKCTTWGTMYQCLNYLLRRAAENKDAASRTVDSRNAVQAELVRRMKAAIGLA